MMYYENGALQKYVEEACYNEPYNGVCGANFMKMGN